MTIRRSALGGIVLGLGAAIGVVGSGSAAAQSIQADDDIVTTGTVTASAFVGDGTNVTGVDADTVGGVDVLAAVEMLGQCLSSRFLDQGDGSVFDCWTGLYWLADAACFTDQNWANAKAWAAALHDSGTVETTDDCGLVDGSAAGDWRLATWLDWVRMMETAREFCDPSLTDDSGRECWSSGTSSLASVQSAVYWTSTPGNAEGWAKAAWAGSSGGIVGQQISQENKVWPVRDGQ